MNGFTPVARPESGPLFQLVETHLRTKTDNPEASLLDFIAQRRPQVNPTPYRLIAMELIEITGVDITHEAVRRWHVRATEVDAAAA